jgi:peptide/nickel transport system substrate-binding protein
VTSASRRVLVLGALLAAIVAGCKGETVAVSHANPKAGPPAYGDTLIEGTIGDISGLLPNITSDGASLEIGGLLYDGLLTQDKDRNIVPKLAESWQFSPDCRELTFKLKKNVRWHDGKPFTAEDVQFTHAAMIHPKTPSAYKESFLQAKSVDVVDAHTVRIRYDKPYAKSLQSWAMTMLPKHLLQKWVEEGRLRESPQHQKAPVGTGPYVFKEWKSGEKIVLVANPDYHDGKPYLSRLVFRVIPSQATIFLELKAKGVDAVGRNGVGGLTAVQYARMTDYAAFQKEFNKFRFPSNGYTYFGFNFKDPRFADRRVRQAFAHAIDKKELLEGVLLGLGREATGPYKPGTWPYTDKVKRYAYDPARAKALLAEAGWVDTNNDGIVDKDGKPFAFEILTNQGNDERKKVAEIVQASLKRIGVKTDIRVLEWATFLKEYIKKRRFEALIMGWGIGWDPDQYDVWHSSKTGPDDLNHISYANPEVDRLLELGRGSCNKEERTAHYHRLQEVLAEEQPLVFLYFRDSLPVVSSRIHGIVPAPQGIDHNFPRWYVPLELQRYTSG